jgi:hypothetical protein
MIKDLAKFQIGKQYQPKIRASSTLHQLEVSQVLELQNQFYFRGTLSKPPSLSEGSFCHILSATITISATNIIKRSQIHVNRTKSFTDRFDDTCISPTAKMLPPVRLYNQVKIKLNAKVLPLTNSQYIEVKEPISARQ